MPEREIVNVYLDALEENEREVAVPTRPKPTALGITVDMTVHGAAFKRRWPEPAKPLAEAVVPPRVRMADPPPGKVPANAQRAADALSAAGFEVRITYGVSGRDRATQPRGECELCGFVGGLKNDGTMRKHSLKDEICTGSLTKPSEITYRKGQPPRGACEGCGYQVTMDPKNRRVVSKHAKPCAGSGENPANVMPGEEIPPVESIAVRVKRFGAACWVDKKWDMGGVVEGSRIILLGYRGWKAKVDEACERVHGERSALLPDAEPGR